MQNLNFEIHDIKQNARHSIEMTCLSGFSLRPCGKKNTEVLITQQQEKKEETLTDKMKRSLMKGTLKHMEA